MTRPLTTAAGAHDPLVLVHGLSGSARWWRPIVPELEERRRVHVLDLPGFGARRGAGLRFELSQAAGWLAAWLERGHLRPVDLVGHSMGGLICLQLAAEEPELVRRLVLIAPAGIPTGRSALGHVVPLARALAAAGPRFLPVLAHDALRAGPATLWRTAQSLLLADVRVDLKRVRIPTLLVWGDRDPLVPATLAEVFRSEIEGSRLLLLEGCGHVPMYDRPRELARAVTSFLAGEAVGE